MIKIYWTLREQRTISQFTPEEKKLFLICVENNYYWKNMLTDIKINVTQKLTRRIKHEQTSKYATFY